MKNLFRRIYYLRSFLRFKRCGKNIILSRGGTFIRPEQISFGNNVFINSKFHISAKNLTIGNNVMIGPNVVIECDDHIFTVPGKTMFEIRKDRYNGSVKIEDDVWIGANVTILKNVVVGEGCVVGAGSVVTKSIPPYTISVGVPNEVLKARFSVSELEEHLKIVNSKKDFSEIIGHWKKVKII